MSIEQQLSDPIKDGLRRATDTYRKSKDSSYDSTVNAYSEQFGAGIMVGAGSGAKRAMSFKRDATTEILVVETAKAPTDTKFIYYQVGGKKAKDAEIQQYYKDCTQPVGTALYEGIEAPVATASTDIPERAVLQNKKSGDLVGIVINPPYPVDALTDKSNYLIPSITTVVALLWGLFIGAKSGRIAGFLNKKEGGTYIMLGLLILLTLGLIAILLL